MIKIHIPIALCILFTQALLNAANIIYNKTDGKIVASITYQQKKLDEYYPCPAESAEVLRINTKSQANFMLTKGLLCRAYKISITIVDGPNAGRRLRQDIPFLDPNLCIYIENKGGTLTATQIAQ